jgi:transcriptional regulator
MYLPDHFAETDPATVQQLLADYPLGALVTLSSSGLEANHIPFLYDPAAGPHGTLRGHVARNNAVWHDTQPTTDALVIFQGPQAYISPNWYPSKQRAHEVVPTYNYAVVHAYGPLQIFDDERWLRGFLGRLTKVFEAPQAQPWKMGDAPQEYLRGMIADGVGIEIPVTRLLGKWKVSQNRLPADRAGAATGLAASGDAEQQAMAALIRARQG